MGTKIERVLREALRRCVHHLGNDGAHDDEETRAAAHDDYHAARMLVGEACGGWDGDAAERGMTRIRSWAYVGAPSAIECQCIIEAGDQAECALHNES
jgi:hypothetical protein